MKKPAASTKKPAAAEPCDGDDAPSVSSRRDRNKDHAFQLLLKENAVPADIASKFHTPSVSVKRDIVNAMVRGLNGKFELNLQEAKRVFSFFFL